MKRFRLLLMLLIATFIANAQANYTFDHGAIIRGDSTQKQIALVFTADEWYEGLDTILKSLQAENIRASFFFTGKLLKQNGANGPVRLLLAGNNYIGSHSFGHLLYCDWEDRNKLLVSMDSFKTDLNESYRLLKSFSLYKKDVKYFLPPYEWFNDSTAKWTKSEGLQLVNFTPGTYSNADYTTPSMGKRYLPSQEIFKRIISFEMKNRSGLNGFILLLHAGTDPARTDKFYFKLRELISVLKSRGYDFVRIDELLKQ